MIIGEKTRSLHEASSLVAEAFELWELEDMCRVWYNTHPSGLVNRQEFTKYATEFLQLPMDAEEHIERMFALIDKNKDGMLSFTELSLALATLARGSTEDKLELGFRLNDLNGDGYISGEEVWKAVHVLWLAGGNLQLLELQDTSDNELARAFLRIADTDGDERISMEEYKVVALRDRRFLQRMLRDTAVVEFNRDPEKNLHVLAAACSITSEEHLAETLRTAAHLTRIAIGELLGLDGVVAGFDMARVRVLYMQALGLSGCTLDAGLRTLMQHVHPPDDEVKMERLFKALSDCYVQSNGVPLTDASTSTSVYGGVLAIIKLNTNLHNPNAEEKMTLQNFVHETRGTFHCGAIDTSMLDAIYHRVLQVSLAYVYACMYVCMYFLWSMPYTTWYRKLA
jgi:Ca2+-binding EF-hand superfamily protein